MAELESTVQRLELEDVSLDESIRLFSRGVELTAMCNTILGEIEGKIVRLVESGPGEIKEEPYS
ncbi:MAG: exodeoxyribonuclease VII small subunit [Clostridiales bacterium]|nr:exodeoxyribonuclease VII small subunit [Clostridiales bacterium]